MDCYRFRSGKYFFTTKPGGVRIEISRSNSNQTQFNPVTDTITGYDIKWTGDCQYEAYKTYRTKKNLSPNEEMKAFLELDNVKVFKFKIIQASQNYYIYECRTEDNSFINMDTLWVSY